MSKAKIDTKQSIIEAIQSLAHPSDLSQTVLSFFEALGYSSERQLPLSSPTYECFEDSYVKNNFHANNFKPEKALSTQWKYVDFLFQITAEELKEQLAGFSTQTIDNTIIESYLFFVLELEQNEYSRSQLSQITREINKLFSMPVMILFKHDTSLTLAIINRRLHKKDQSKDVLEKVTLIKDISTQSPHRAHIEILFDLSLPEIIRKYKVNNFVELHQAWQKTLDTKELNKNFYKELSNWYFWTIKHISFPGDIEKNEEIRNATSLIRLLTRIIFIWFIKEKGLVDEKLFTPSYLKQILHNFDSNSTDSSFYQAILQNLFFATLNQKISERKFTKNGCLNINKLEYGIKTLFRYDEQFSISKEQVLELFKPTPFLNGGLFDCLDKEDKEDKARKEQYADGFSRNPSKRAKVPNFLFFGEETEIDLNPIYDTSKKKYTSRGLITILNGYKFTITENSPIEEEIALDPELLGKVFENLLASYNPETQTTARKSTGSFYTPREIVHYMVDESLLAFFKQKLEDQDISESEEKLRSLIGYNEDPNPFNPNESQFLIQAVDCCKILDPACGSGAFPMGILQKMVHVLHKLDPNNQLWKELQRQKAIKETEKAFNIGNKEEREYRLKEISDVFEHNSDDYGRKLYLIENCIYGVDIQPIAIQIAKLRFFISLIIDQKKQSTEENYGIRALPNLETKFVCANTLIGLDRPEGFIRDPAIEVKEQEIKMVRQDYFNSKIREQKLAFQEKDKALRDQISILLINDGWNDVSAKQVSRWDPYEQNASSPFFDPEWMFGIKEGFDIVIANPPYLRVQGLQQTQPEFIDFYRKEFVSAKGSFDLYALFIEKGYMLLSEKGVFSYIVPHKFFQATFGKSLREYIEKNNALMQIVRFGAEQIFDEVTTYTCILFLTKLHKVSFDLIEVSSLTQFPDALKQTFSRNINPGYSIQNTSYKKLNNNDSKWDFSVKENNNVLERIKLHNTKLGDITKKIFQGIATSADKIFVLKVTEDNEKTLRCYSKQLDKEIEIEKSITKPFLMGKDLHRYENPNPCNIIVFPYLIDNNKAILMNHQEISSKFPLCWRYLLENQSFLENREHGRFKEIWWSFSRPQNMTEFEVTKIMTPEIALGCQMTLDLEGSCFHTTKIYSFVFKNEAKGSLKYFLGVLNSSILWFFIRQTGYVLRGNYFTFKTNYLSPFTMPNYSFHHANIIETLVGYVLFLKNVRDKLTEGQTSELLVSISFFEQLIDSIVFELYFPDEFLGTFQKPSQILLESNMFLSEDNSGKYYSILSLFRELYQVSHPARKTLFELDSNKTYQTIKEQWNKV